MENQNTKIDEIFRLRLHDAEVPPPPFVWPAVESELRKSHKRLALWLIAFGTLAVGAWLWQSDLWSNANHAIVSIPVADNPKEEQAVHILEQENPTQNTITRVEKAPIQSTKMSNSETTNLTLAKGKLAPNSPQKGARISAEDFDPIAKKGDEHRLKISDGQNISSLATAKLSPTPEEPNFSASNTEVSFLTTQSLQINDPQLVTSAVQPPKTALPKAFKPFARRKKEQPKFCYDFARHPSAWMIDVYAGPALAQRSLTSRLDDEPYLKQRLATEQRSTAMTAGLRASLMFNGNFLVRTGLNFDRVTEQFEYIDPTYIKLTIKNNYVNGQFVGTDTVVEYGENYLKTYNRYTMLDIPLMVGIEMRHGRSGFSINAGFSANVLFQKGGVIIDPNTHEPARFGRISNDPNAVGPKTALSQDVFRTNLGLSATASVQWYWHLNSHFRLFVEPSFRQVLRPVTLGSHPVEQRYSMLGLRLGATKIF